jgi:alkane 1-monooxygenase
MTPTPADAAPCLPLAAFWVASLLPMAMLLAGAGFGAGWFLATFLYVAVFSAALDRVSPFVSSAAPEGAEFPAAAPLLVLIGLGHLALVPLAVWIVAGDSGLGGRQRVIAFLAFALTFGQISIPAAHELIHRPDRWLYRLGVAIYVTLLFGHHASAHRLVHHVHVATPQDPNSARRGESLYAFLPRAWLGSFRAGLRAETARRRPGRGLHPYVGYLGGAALCLALAAALAGWQGSAALLGMAGLATVQLLMSDYVQHYGLRRRVLPNGRPEPVGAAHSWNAPQWFTGAMMLHAPRHSDHHAHPSRPFPALRLPPSAPELPRGLPAMATLALLPPLWRRVMHPRLDRLTSRESDIGGAGAPAGDLSL